LDKSGIIVGSVLGATIILVIFAFILVPPANISQPELIVSNGHSVSTVGETTPIIKQSKLSLVQLFEQSESGVVRIVVDREGDVLGRSGLGSGFVYNALGHIVTNAHVVDGSNKITVTFLDGRQYNAEMVGADPFTDIAVVKVDADPSLLEPLPIGDSDNLKVGEGVAAIGNPFGLSGSMTSGIVSALGRTIPSQEVFSIPDVIQTDAAINPGNSGGPLLNMKGQVIGINTAIRSSSGEFTGVGFSIPSRTVLKIVPILIEEGAYHHPWMGISGRDIDPDFAKVLGLQDAKGFLVVQIVEGSPADKAGLHGSDKTKEVDGVNYPMGGDIILSVDRKEVRSIDDILIHLQREKSVGDKMVMQILRDGRTTDITIMLGERPTN